MEDPFRRPRCILYFLYHHHPLHPRVASMAGLPAASRGALDVVAYMYADGDRTNALVSAQYKEIMDTIEYEKNAGATLSVKQLFKTPSARKRVTLAMSAAIFSTIAGMFIIFIPSSYSHSVQGNVIASYYLGTMLDNAGITNSTVQLEIVRTLTKNSCEGWRSQ